MGFDILLSVGVKKSSTKQKRKEVKMVVETTKLCENCMKAKNDPVSKDGKECTHKPRWSSGYGWKSLEDIMRTCNLKIMAECSHETLKYGGKCIGAENCPDYKPKPWYKFW